MEVEENKEHIGFIMLSREISYPRLTRLEACWKPTEEPERASASALELLTKYENKTLVLSATDAELVKKYPELVNFSLDAKDSFMIDRESMANYLRQRVNDLGLVVSYPFKTSDYELKVDFPYFYKGKGNQLETSIAVSRHSNSYKKHLFLDLKNRRYFSEPSGNWSSRVPQAQAQNYTLYARWTQDDLNQGRFAEIEGKITSMLNLAAAAIVEAHNCAQVTPGQRGKKSTCKSCEFQLSCSISKVS